MILIPYLYDYKRTPKILGTSTLSGLYRISRVGHLQTLQLEKRRNESRRYLTKFTGTPSAASTDSCVR